jgi:hypothetical protein
MVEPLRHRQTKEAATAMFNLQPPRHISTLQILLQKSFCTRDQNSFGCTRDFRVNMWGTSLREDKLTGDLGNVIEATSIGGRRSDFFTARKLAPGNLGLLQQYLPVADSCAAANEVHGCNDLLDQLVGTNEERQR